ncbi:MAG: hypothetical protein LBB84_00490 [Tannerellaceae bacterium]|jgi:hypothetical protein|nr:hypothetical protein [Tannerellaceae bacterium]
MKTKVAIFTILHIFFSCYSCTVSNETEKYQRSRNNIIHVQEKVIVYM